MEIFEQYFYDLNQFIRLPGNNTGHSDMVTNLEEKISLFERYDQVAEVGTTGDVMISSFSRLYRLELVRIDYSSESRIRVAEEIQLNELSKYGESSLGKWTKSRPVYTRYSNSITAAMKVYPNPGPSIGSNDRVLISYIQKPLKPSWGYVVVSDKPLYNSATSIDFELHPSEESELVYRVLALAGIAVEKPQLMQAAMGLEGTKIQQEKQ